MRKSPGLEAEVKPTNPDAPTLVVPQMIRVRVQQLILIVRVTRVIPVPRVKVTPAIGGCVLPTRTLPVLKSVAEHRNKTL